MAQRIVSGPTPSILPLTPGMMLLCELRVHARPWKDEKLRRRMPQLQTAMSRSRSIGSERRMVWKPVHRRVPDDYAVSSRSLRGIERLIGAFNRLFHGNAGVQKGQASRERHVKDLLAVRLMRQQSEFVTQPVDNVMARLQVGTR